MNLFSIFLYPNRSVESDQSGLTGISLNLSLFELAPTASANNSTILLFPVPEIPERITKGLVFKLR